MDLIEDFDAHLHENSLSLLLAFDMPDCDNDICDDFIPQNVSRNQHSSQCQQWVWTQNSFVQSSQQRQDKSSIYEMKKARKQQQEKLNTMSRKQSVETKADLDSQIKKKSKRTQKKQIQ